LKGYELPQYGCWNQLAISGVLISINNGAMMKIKTATILSLLIGYGVSVTAQQVVSKEKDIETLTASSSTINRTLKKENMIDDTKQKLNLAEQRTKDLYKAVEDRGLIVPGKLESVLNAEIVKLAKDEFGMENHWHKKIVRSGVNTLQSYSGNPPDREIQRDDVVFLDYGPIFEGHESDVGRTYVLGDDPAKLKLKSDVEKAWNEAKEWYLKQTHLTGAEFFNYLKELARHYGYEYGGEIGGHIIGPFPHEQPDKANDLSLDIHPDNHASILLLDKNGKRRQWVLEIQFVDKAKGIGGFYEQMLN
jgi:Xaa-Pro aminopeptidase